MKEKKCIHKWKYMGFYNSGYYNSKVCIYCEKMKLEKTNKIMEPRDKAMELMLKYYNAIPMNTVSFAKQFALIAVDEIIKVIHTNMEDKYWQEVKQYIIEL